MTYKEFVASRKKPGQDIMDSWGASKVSAVHMLVGVADEMREFEEALDETNAEEELGDLIFYVEGLLQDFGMTLPEEVNADFHSTAFMEMFTMVKRHLFYNKELDLDKLQESAIQTIKHSLAHLTVVWDVRADYSALREQNVAKLTKRYETGYSDKAAQDRADKA